MTYWIAEVGEHPSLVRRPELEDIQAAGFCAVKLQMWRPETTYPGREVPILDVLEPDELRKIVAMAPKGLDVGVSVTEPCHVAEAASVATWLKVGSYEACCWKLLTAAQQTGKLRYISVGMTTTAELAHIRRVARGATLLHCVSLYPCPADKTGLERMDEDGLGGYSDHTGSEAVVSRAVDRYDASDVELHVCLRGAAKAYEWSLERAAHIIAACEGKHDTYDPAIDRAERRYRRRSNGVRGR
jgi:sialic acid synthase SpsE